MPLADVWPAAIDVEQIPGKGSAGRPTCRLWRRKAVRGAGVGTVERLGSVWPYERITRDGASSPPLTATSGKRRRGGRNVGGLPQDCQSRRSRSATAWVTAGR